MNHSSRSRWLLLLPLAFSGILTAQTWTAHMGAGGSIPTGQSADFVGINGTIVAGLGYRWSGNQALLVQYYGTGFPFKSSVRDQLGFLQPNSQLFSITANYQLEFLKSKPLRPYVIGGTGWYRRVSSITRPALIGEVACSPYLDWWGYACDAGFVPLDQIVAASSSDVLGYNVGAGISGQLREKGPPRWYVEFRYHYAPNRGTPTQTLPIVLGVTW